jgi:DNA-binding PadR family transcriptional regulator
LDCPHKYWFRYIKKEVVELNNKQLDVYFLTEEGEREINKITDWMELIIKVVQLGEKNAREF